MTTDTRLLAPTDADLSDLGHECELDAVAFGRAVLAKWGTPDPVGVEPVAIYHGRCTMDADRYRWLAKEHGWWLLKRFRAVRPYVDPSEVIDESIDAAIAAQQGGQQDNVG